MERSVNRISVKSVSNIKQKGWLYTKEEEEKKEWEAGLKKYFIFILATIFCMFAFSTQSEGSSRMIRNRNRIARENNRIIRNENRVVISFAGDCTLGSDLRFGRWGSFVEAVEQHGYAYFFENVLHIFENDNLTVVNLEGPLTDATYGADKEFVFRGDKEFVNILVEGSINLVNIENNHIFDYFQQGYDDTINVLRENGIGYFGGNIAHIETINGIRFGFLGYMGFTDYEGLRDRITRDIGNLRAMDVDIVIISFHWGEELSNHPNQTQMDLARFSIGEGADFIFGHHPHVIQGIEIYQGKPIVYSLGNFSFGGNRNPRDHDTFIFQMIYIIDGDDITFESRIIPSSISSTRHRNDYRPTPSNWEDSLRIRERLLEYSQGFNSEEFINRSFVMGLRPASAKRTRFLADMQ